MNKKQFQRLVNSVLHHDSPLSKWKSLHDTVKELIELGRYEKVVAPSLSTILSRLAKLDVYEKEPKRDQARCEFVTQLLQAGSDPNITSCSNRSGSDRRTLLQLTVFHRQSSMVKTLLLHGADPNEGSLSELLPLHRACNHGDVPLARCLLQAGADPLLICQRFTALHFAIKQKNLALVQLLMDNTPQAPKLLCCRENPIFLGGTTPLQMARESFAPEIVDYLVGLCSSLQLSKRHPSWVGALLIACQCNNLEIVKLLLSSPSSEELLSAVNDKKETCLHLALRCCRGDFEIVRHLVERKPALVNARNERMETPLFSACSRWYRSEVDFLLCNGADPTARDLDSKSALHVAAESGDAVSTRLILAKAQGSGLLDEQTQDGWTALHLACRGEKYEVANALIQYGANLTIKTEKSQTAYDLIPIRSTCMEYQDEAYEERQNEKLKYDLTNAYCNQMLQMHGRQALLIFLQATTPLGVLGWGGVGNIVEKFLDQDEVSVIGARDEATGDFPIHIVCRRGFPDFIVKLLAERDETTLQVPDASGALPFHLWLSHRSNQLRQASTCQYFLQAYPESVSVEVNGFLPFLIAATSDTQLDIVYELVRRDHSSRIFSSSGS